jgi:predicted ABC-type exoprotein transport system permease subunit
MQVHVPWCRMMFEKHCVQSSTLAGILKHWRTRICVWCTSLRLSIVVHGKLYADSALQLLQLCTDFALQLLHHGAPMTAEQETKGLMVIFNQLLSLDACSASLWLQMG